MNDTTGVGVVLGLTTAGLFLLWAIRVFEDKLSGAHPYELPTLVQNALVQMPEERKEEFNEEFRRRARPLGMAYLLWAVGGWHYAYLGRWAIQFAYWFSLGGIGIWAVADLYRLPDVVRDANKDIAVETLKTMQGLWALS